MSALAMFIGYTVLAFCALVGAAVTALIGTFIGTRLYQTRRRKP